jgi:hypothetical protein
VQELPEKPAPIFRQGFLAWCAANMDIVERFFSEADRVWDSGRRHYSARTIIHYMRHESALVDSTGEYKINNNVSPDLARLYMRAYPDRRLFELRGRDDE